MMAGGSDEEARRPSGPWLGKKSNIGDPPDISPNPIPSSPKISLYERYNFESAVLDFLRH